MRKMNLILIIIWSLVALLIATALVVGIVYRNSAIVITRGIHNPSDRELLVDQTLSLDGIMEVDISLMSETVDIFPAVDDQLRVVQYGVNLEPHRIIEVQASGSSIKIQRVGSGRNGNQFSLFGLGNMINQSWVEVYLPASYNNDLEIDLSSGAVQIDADLDLRDFSIDSSSGSIESEHSILARKAGLDLTSGTIILERLEAKEFEIEISSGTIKIANLTGSGEVEVTSGTMRLGNVSIAEYLDVDVSSGGIEVSLAGDPSLQFQGQVSSGSIHTYFEKYSKGEHSKKYFATVGDGPYKTLTADVTSGTIRINSADGRSTKTSSYDSSHDWNSDRKNKDHNGR